MDPSSPSLNTIVGTNDGPIVSVILFPVIGFSPMFNALVAVPFHPLEIVVHVGTAPVPPLVSTCPVVPGDPLICKLPFIFVIPLMFVINPGLPITIEVAVDPPSARLVVESINGPVIVPVKVGDAFGAYQLFVQAVVATAVLFVFVVCVNAVSVAPVKSCAPVQVFADPFNPKKVFVQAVVATAVLFVFDACVNAVKVPLILAVPVIVVFPLILTEPPLIFVEVLVLRPNVVVVAVDVPSERVVAESIDGQVTAFVKVFVFELKFVVFAEFPITIAPVVVPEPIFTEVVYELATPVPDAIFTDPVVGTSAVPARVAMFIAQVFPALLAIFTAPDLNTPLPPAKLNTPTD